MERGSDEKFVANIAFTSLRVGWVLAAQTRGQSPLLAAARTQPTGTTASSGAGRGQHTQHWATAVAGGFDHTGAGVAGGVGGGDEKREA